MSFIQEKELTLSLSYGAILAELSKESPIRNLETSGAPPVSYTRSMSDDQMYASTLRNIMIWLPITLSVILYFVIMSLADMSVHKNSILYAKYGTTKQMQVAQ